MSALLGELTIERAPLAVNEPTLVYMQTSSFSSPEVPRRGRSGTSQATIVTLADQAGEAKTDLEQSTGTRMPFSGSGFTGFAYVGNATVEPDADSASHVL